MKDLNSRKIYKHNPKNQNAYWFMGMLYILGNSPAVLAFRMP